MTSPLVLADLAGRDKVAMLDHVVAHLMRHARPPVPEAAIRRQLTALDRIGWHIGAALLGYVPQRLEGAMEVLLFECRGGMTGAENPLGLPDDPATHSYREGWADLFGAPITRIPVESDHFGLFTGAAGAEVGARLSAPAPGHTGGRAQVEALVLGLVREILPDAPPDAVVPERSMSELGATSIDRVEVATLAMEALGLTVPHQELARVSSIGELIEALHRHLGARND
jgi:polyketide biosynthesis acyl carrier protein